MKMSRIVFDSWLIFLKHLNWSSGLPLWMVFSGQWEAFQALLNLRAGTSAWIDNANYAQILYVFYLNVSWWNTIFFHMPLPLLNSSQEEKWYSWVNLNCCVLELSLPYPIPCLFGWTLTRLRHDALLSLLCLRSCNSWLKMQWRKSKPTWTSWTFGDLAGFM